MNNLNKYVAALDVGTTGTRTIIFDLNGIEIARDYKEWESIFPSPVMVEQKATVWWNAVHETIVNAMVQAKLFDRSN